MSGGRAFAAALFAALASVPIASRRTAAADWPCAQRLVPHLAAASLWPGPPAQDDWRGAQDVSALVERIVPRSVPEAEGVAAIDAFAAPLDPAARRRLLPLAFAGAVDETNRARDGLIEQIERFARRQRGLAEGVRNLEAELRAMPPDAGAARAELEQRHFYAAKSYTDAQRTVRFACEAPVRLEARLGAYARALAAALPTE